MAIDKLERAYLKPPKKKHVEPFVLIPSEVLNSPAYRDLGYSARSMLIELIHYYSGTNNGYIWISPDVLNARGFSKNTATKALKELRTHGLIYMTKRGGNQRGGCSWFALTWRPINRIEGQFLGQFVANQYRHWVRVDKSKGVDNGTRYPNNWERVDKACDQSASKEIDLNTGECLKVNLQIPNSVTYKDMPYIG
ncbi:hypothetical protein G6662_07370 [Polynucleobacter paneuropaeus]|nr:hypothetical protein [Polynucleobacter paneuropaeus]